MVAKFSGPTGMEITLKPARGNKTATSKLQKRFDRLCSQVESAEKRNRNLDSQLDELVRRHDELMRFLGV